MRILITKILIALSSLWLVTASAEATPDYNYNKKDGERFLFVFNQPEYAAGDTAFFSAYLLAGENRIPVKEQIVSIKLMGQTKEIIHYGRILFHDGIGTSQVIIPQNIKPGNYQFVEIVLMIVPRHYRRNYLRVEQWWLFSYK